MQPLDRKVFDRRWVEYGFLLGQTVSQLRKERGLTQEDLAFRAGMSRNAISNIERNENTSHCCSDPALSTIYKLSAALSVTPADLLPRAERKVVDGDPGFTVKQKDK